MCVCGVCECVCVVCVSVCVWCVCVCISDYTATKQRLSDSDDIGQSDHQRWSVSYKCNSVKRNVM